MKDLNAVSEATLYHNQIHHLLYFKTNNAVYSFNTQSKQVSKIENNRIQTTADDMPVQVGSKYFLIADKDAPSPKMICLSNLQNDG